MTLIVFFWVCLTASCGHAFIRGGRPERLVALAVVLGTAASLAALPPIGHRQGEFFWRVALVDLIVLALFVAVALRYDRYWPMLVAGFQLATVGTEVIVLVQRDLVTGAIEDLLSFWTYPILASVLLGSLAYRRRVARTSQRQADGANRRN